MAPRSGWWWCVVVVACALRIVPPAPARWITAGGFGQNGCCLISTKKLEGAGMLEPWTCDMIVAFDLIRSGPPPLSAAGRFKCEDTHSGGRQRIERGKAGAVPSTVKQKTPNCLPASNSKRISSFKSNEHPFSWSHCQLSKKV